MRDNETPHTDVDARIDDSAPGEEAPEPTDDPMTALRDIKRYGFARRPDGTLIRRADLDRWSEADAASTVPNDVETDVAPPLPAPELQIAASFGATEAAPEPPPDSAEPALGSTHRLRQRLQGQNALRAETMERQDPYLPSQEHPKEEENPTSYAPTDDHQGAGDPVEAGPLKRTAYTERLRAEMARSTAPLVPEEVPSIDAEDNWTAKPKAPDTDLVSPVQDDETENFDDVAVTIGRVVSTRGSVVWGALFDDVGGQASKAARMGTLVSMRGTDSRVFGIVNGLEREQQAGVAQAERTIFEIQVLGEIADDRQGFQRGVSSYPPLDAPVTTVTLRDIAIIYARPATSNIHIGQLRHNPKIPAFALTDSLLGKHFAVLGTTGAGKSCAVTVILQSILDEHPLGHIVLLDPHNEYAPAFGDQAELLNPGNLQLPYWLLNFEEIAHILLGSSNQENRDAQTALLKDAIIHAKKAFAGENDIDSQITVDTPVPYRLSDLVSKLKDGMGMLNKTEGSSRYLGLISRIESLRADKRYAFMFQSLTVKDNMEQILAQLLRIPTKGKPITIIDISGLPSEIVDVVVSVLFRLTFELAVWSERGKAPPVLLVCEEAHRYVPEEAGMGFAPTQRVIAQIAKEGRKYGVTLCLVSQRPSELAINSLAQCNTVFALRLSNEHDQAFVARTLSENSRWLVDSLPSLNTQEAVVVGDGVTVPVHIRFNDLDPDRRPASHDPSFSKSWREETDDAFLHQAIERWRRQTR